MAGEPGETEHQEAGGLVRLRLPAGQDLRHLEGGVGYWSPDAQQGRFMVSTGAASEEGDALLAAERAGGGTVDVDLDVHDRRGGLDVRRLRYRSSQHVPRDVGGEDLEMLSDLLFVTEGASSIRVGYSVRTDAPAPLQEAFARVLDSVRIGSER